MSISLHRFYKKFSRLVMCLWMTNSVTQTWRFLVLAVNELCISVFAPEQSWNLCWNREPKGDTPPNLSLFPSTLYLHPRQFTCPKALERLSPGSVLGQGGDSQEPGRVTSDPGRLQLCRTGRKKHFLRFWKWCRRACWQLALAVCLLCIGHHGALCGGAQLGLTPALWVGHCRQLHLTSETTQRH